MSEKFTFTTNPLEVKNLLGNSNRCYLIPEYQRDYRWKAAEEQCEQLWIDLTGRFKDAAENPYYLGSIIAHRSEKRLCIIDGQQRLITLSLLLRQIFSKIYGKDNLAYRQQSIYFGDNEETVDKDGNPSWSIPTTSEPRIVSKVLGEEENAKLRYALDVSGTVSKPLTYKNSRYEENSDFFKEQVEKFHVADVDDEGTDSKKLLNFSKFVTEKVHLLLIETEDFNDALTIFNTVNNRGMQLAEGDIIKAALFKQAGKEHKEFNEKWNEISKILHNGSTDDEENNTSQNEIEELLASPKDKQSSVMTDLFRVYMHVLRAKRGIDYDIVGLLAFFSEGKNGAKAPDADGSWHKIGDEKLPWKQVMDDIERLTAACQIAVSNKYPQVSNWLTALRILGKRECLMPPLVWIFNNLESCNAGEDNENKRAYCLPEDKLTDCESFFRNIVRFVFASSIVGKLKITNNLFKATASVYDPEKWKFDFASLKDDVKRSFNEKDKVPVQLGLVYLLELLRSGNSKIIPLGQVEHILPQKTNKGVTAGWETEEQIQKAKFRLGNLVLLEGFHNKEAGNKAFVVKKDIYPCSGYATAREVGKLSQWLYGDWKERNEANIQRILDFLIEGK